VSGRSYDGPALDGTFQPISEAPYWQGDGETVDATPADEGEVRAENVPVPDGGAERPDVEGQTTLDDWGWSA
jgi:hypothetical protein